MSMVASGLGSLGGLFEGGMEFLFGESGQPGQVIDTTPEEFEALRQQLADAVSQMIADPATPEGPMVAPLGTAEQQLLQQLQGFSPATGFQNQALQSLQGVPQGTQQQAMQQLLGGLPQGAQNQAVQQLLSGPQQGAQNQAVQQLLQGLPQGTQQQAMQQLLSGLPQGTQQQAMQQLLSGLPQGAQQQAVQQLLGGLQQGPQQQALQGLAGGPQADLLNQTLSGAFLSPDSNPFLQASIETAQRPILEQFGDQTQALRAQFARAGHTLAPEGSSPFDMAQARLAGDVAGALGDVGTRLTSENLARERGLQSQAVGQQLQSLMGTAGIGQGMGQQQLQALTSAAGAEQGMGQQLIQALTGAAGIEQGAGQQLLQSLMGAAGIEQGTAQQLLQSLTGAAGIEQGAEQQLMQSLTNAAGIEQGTAQQLLQSLTGAAGIEQGIGQQAVQGAQVGSGIEQGMNQQALNSLLSNLQAQALPRMIEDMGLQRGLQEFQRQQQQLLQALGISAGLAMPQTQVLPGTSSTPGLIHMFAQGAGQGIGQAFAASDRRLKRDIRRVGTTPGGLPLYEFRYLWGGPLRRGVMAEDVLQRIPDAVSTLLGYHVVDYSKVT